jgi:C6 transcription factor Pro1
MHSPESQRVEIERIKKAVSESLKARRAFRISKRTARASQNSTEAHLQGSRVNQTGVSDMPEEYQAESFEKLSLSNDQSRGKTRYDHPGLVVLPITEPWPKSLSELGSQGIAADTTPVVNDTPSSGLSFHPNIRPAENRYEYTMVMNYLDNIFPLQFYFYRPSAVERGRGWLLRLLLQAKSSYFTTLAFSAVHQMLYVYNGNVAMEQQLSSDLDRYHSLAIGELQKELDYLPRTSGSEHLRIGVDILACSMQLLSIEVFRTTTFYKGWKGDWEMHLRAAGALLSIIGTDLRISSDEPCASTSADTTSSRTTSTDSTASQLPLNMIAGLDFFTTTYAWCDIFRWASLGPDSVLEASFPYSSYLEEDRICLDRLMGCRNWAMICIREISILEGWKNDMRKRRCLSIPELSSQATFLKKRLRAGLETIQKDFDRLNVYEQERELVTEVYALSAFIYLAVVVSGNSHLLPEVRKGVNEALSSLRALPQHLLIRVSWAYCVAGCMADNSEQKIFRELVSTADANGHNVGTLWNGLELMERFWMLRETLDDRCLNDGCPWAVAMKHMDLKILLI